MSVPTVAADLVDRSALLRILPDRERQLLLDVARERRFEADELLVQEGEPSDSLHLVATGHAAVETGRNGSASLLVVMGPGDVFGELSLVDGSARRSASVRALDEVSTFEITRDAFDRLRTRLPIVDRYVQALLGARVRRLTQQLTEALQVPVEQRVARRVLALSQVYGGKVPGTVVPLTQEQLAQLSGATRSTVNRVLRALEADGALDLQRGQITLRDPSVVAARAGGTDS